MKKLQQDAVSRLFIAVVILLIIFASRAQFLTGTPLHIDEARSGMRMMGTVEEVIAWQPPDWPPLHNVLLSGWAFVAGEKPISLRLFSALFSIVSVCLAYRMAYYLTQDRRVAWGTLIFYAGLGMSVHLGIYIRGYAITIALLPLALWLTARYFDLHHKKDAVLLAITLGIMFLSTYTAVVGFIFIGLYSVLFYGRQLWRWVIIGILASPFVAFEIIRKWDFWTGRLVSRGGRNQLTYFLDWLYADHYQNYFGQAEIFWFALIIVAIVLIVLYERQHRRLFVWVVSGAIIAPLTTLFLVKSGFFVLMSPRYTWWVLIMLALGFSIGLRYLPRYLYIGILAIVLGLMCVLRLEPVFYFEEEVTYFYEDNMEWLSHNMQPGDKLIFDPNYCIRECLDLDGLTYFWEVYLNDTVTRIDEPTKDDRRIWLWRGVGHSRELVEQLRETHVPSIFFGHPDGLLELYEAPPDPEGILFENGMRFHGFDILHEDNGMIDNPPYDLREQIPLRIRLWWSADRPIDDDYQVSIQLFDIGRNIILVQKDHAPSLIHLKPIEFAPLPQRTGEWVPGELYVEERFIDFPNTNREVHVHINLVIYRLTDGMRVAADATTDDDLLPLDQAVVWGWG